MKKNPEEALDILLSHQDKANYPLVTKIETESLIVLLPKMDSDDAEFHELNDQSWTDVNDWLKEMELIKSAPAIEDMIIEV